MAAASDKARFFLEQSVPELKEYERKGIFSPEEITSIARKRSDFEHKINTRGSTPTDYARYAEFEINVDALRRKRVKRLGIKSTAYNGRRRVFFVFDRGTRKHPGDLGLWIENINFAKKMKANKKLQEIFTQVLRLHPTKSDLWIHAAQYAVEENGDMTEARGYIQRGLRFCKRSKAMWLEYARLEMSYIAKIHARREVLGIGASKSGRGTDADEEKMVQIPDLTQLQFNPLSNGDEEDHSTIEMLESTPATRGAIPIAIFDAAMAQFSDPSFGLDFFTILTDFDRVAASRRIANHVEESLMKSHPREWCSQACHIQVPLISVSTSSPEFPIAFRQVLQRLKDGRQKVDRPELRSWIRGWLEKLMQTEDLDPAVKLVGDSVIGTLSSMGTVQ